MRRRSHAAALLAAGILGATALAGCGGEPDGDSEPGGDAGREPSTAVRDDAGAGTSGAADAGDRKFPDVLEAELTADGDGYRIAVTISSPYDTPERYADGWRVKTTDGDVLAEHDLAHDHANEQPFTRSRGPFKIPEGVTEVVVEGRDMANGYGGDTVTVAVPGRA